METGEHLLGKFGKDVGLNLSFRIAGSQIRQARGGPLCFGMVRHPGERGNDGATRSPGRLLIVLLWRANGVS
jgi:hypothetical protein